MKDLFRWGLISLLFVAISCELPQEPDFVTRHNISLPLVQRVEYKLVGGNDAFLDTTSADLDSLFTIDRTTPGSEGLITISQRVEFEVGDLDDAIPSIDVDPTSLETEIGIIEIDDFSSNSSADVGVLTKEPERTDPVDIDLGLGAAVPIPSGSLNPTFPPLQVENTAFEYAQLEDNVNPDPSLNAITLTLINNTEIPITNDTQSDTPEITLQNSDGNVLGVSNSNFRVFGNPGATEIAPGDSAFVVFQMDGQRLTSEMTYSMNLGTSGSGGVPISGNPQQLQLKALTSEMRFTEARSSVDAQQDIIIETQTTVEGDFQNAQIDEGTMTMNLVNNTEIPLVLDSLVVFNTNPFKARNTGVYFAAGSVIIQETDVNIPANGSVEVVSDISGRGISTDITVRMNSSTPGSGGSQVLVQSVDQVSSEIIGSLSVNQATARIQAQSFSSSNTYEFNTDQFTFTLPEDYVELASGSIEIENLINGIDLGIDTLRISFPGILMPDAEGNYNESDSLVVEFSGANRILRSSQASVLEQSVDLTGARIFAPNNQISYNIYGITEDTRNLPPDDQFRTINATDVVTASVSINDLELAFASGLVEPQYVVMGEDESEDEIVDLDNEIEAQITDLEDLSFLSERIDSIIFSDPSFSFFYTTNVGIPTTVYAAILGIAEDGDEVYLTGKPGSGYEVTQADTISGLNRGGQPLDPSNLIQFTFNGVPDADQDSVQGTILFNKVTTNADEFLSNLPTEFRFIGKAIVNPGSRRGFIIDPIRFETEMGVDMPIDFSTVLGRPAVIEDTLELDALSDLPGEDDDQQLTSGRIALRYVNGLPIRIQLNLDFLEQVIDTLAQDTTYLPVTSLPREDQDELFMIGGDVDPTTLFVNNPAEGVLDFEMNRDQLAELNRTTHLKITARVRTKDAGRVRFNADDFVRLSISVSATTESEF